MVKLDIDEDEWCYISIDLIEGEISSFFSLQAF